MYSFLSLFFCVFLHYWVELRRDTCFVCEIIIAKDYAAWFFARFSFFGLKINVSLFSKLIIGDQKIAAMGIRVSQWITYHGLALNVCMDLAPFHQIIPCGIHDRRVGSIQRLLFEESQARMDLSDNQLIDICQKSLVSEFSEVFQLNMEYKSFSISNTLRKYPKGLPRLRL